MTVLGEYHQRLMRLGHEMREMEVLAVGWNILQRIREAERALEDEAGTLIRKPETS